VLTAVTASIPEATTQDRRSQKHHSWKPTHIKGMHIASQSANERNSKGKVTASAD